jgi:hypothetical protein
VHTWVKQVGVCTRGWRCACLRDTCKLAEYVTHRINTAMREAAQLTVYMTTYGESVSCTLLMASDTAVRYTQ